jgi:Calcium-activated chloride channel
MTDDGVDSEYGTFPSDTESPFELGNPEHGERPSAGWDYVFQYAAPGVPGAFTARSERDDPETYDAAGRKIVLSKLREAGFSYSQFWIPAEKCVLVRFALSEREMKRKAELMGWEGQLKDRYGAAYLPFSVKRESHFANDLRSSAELPYFNSADRVLITLAVLRSRDSTWGASVNVESLIFSGSMKQAFALHKENERSTLVSSTVWARLWDPTYQPPLADIKDYLGARVGLYFAFVSFYARMLGGIGLLSVPVHYIVATSRSGDVVAWARFLFGIAIVYWACYFLILWQRRNAVINVMWGLADHKEDAENDIRPQFRGELRKGFFCKGGFVHLDDMAANVALSSSTLGEAATSRHVEPRPGARKFRTVDYSAETGLGGDTNNVVSDDIAVGGSSTDKDFILSAVRIGDKFDDLPSYPYFSKHIFQRRLYASAAVTVCFALLVLLLTFVLFYYKLTLIKACGPMFGPLVPGVLTGLLISVSDAVWSKTALRLTRWENHRTNQVRRGVMLRCECFSSLYCR